MKTQLRESLYYMILVRITKACLAQKWCLNLLCLLFSLSVFAQKTDPTTMKGMLKITVTDKKTNEPIPFADIVITLANKEIAKATTDLDGNAFIKHLPIGKLTVKVVYLGYATRQVNNVEILREKPTYLNVQMENEGLDLKAIEIVDYKIDLIDKDTKSGGTIDRENFVNMANKSVNSVVATQAGVYQQDAATDINIRGSRPGGTVYFIDGERMVGTTSFPQSSVNPWSKSKTDGTNKTPPTPPTGTEEYGSFVENTFKSASSNPLSTFAIDVDGASYSNARRMLSAGYMPLKDVVRVEEFINYFKYKYPEIKGKDPFGIFTEYADCPWNAQHKLLQVALKGKEIDSALRVPNHFVFLIDVSGSMDAPDKLPLLKRAFSLLIKQLRDEDKISIVVYAGNSGLVLENIGGKNKNKIEDAVEHLEAGGSTAGGEGINLAYRIAEKHYLKNGNNRVILATDGDFNVGVSSEKDLEDLIAEKRNKGIYLSVLGFGEGNIKDNKMEILADKGNGNYYYIDNFMEARKVLVEQFTGTMYAIAKDVKIQVEFNPAKVKEYRLVGYDNRMLAAEDFNNDKKDAGELGAGHCVTALYEIIPAGSSDSQSQVDELKYSIVCSTQNSPDLATVKFRYKGMKKEDTVSKLITQVVPGISLPLDQASANFKLAAGVGEFAMLLKASPYTSNGTFKQCIELATAAKGEDTDHYVSELIELMRAAQEIKPDVAVKK
jgi:Ca-activated chloride channel family protein